MECSDTIRPMLAERNAPAAPKLEPSQSRVADPGLKSRSKNHAVDVMGLPPGDHAMRRKSFDAGAAGVHEMDVWKIEAPEIVVMEARPLTKPAVVGLQRFGDPGVQDDSLDPVPQLVHQLVGAHVSQGFALFRGEWASERVADRLLGEPQNLWERTRPPIADKILLGWKQ